MKLYERIDGRLREFVLAQPVFFVGTAPAGAEGHVNVSPKGMRGTFTVLGEHRVAYLDYMASGVETIAHLRENGRVVLMFCSFSGAPNVVRLHGRGRAVVPSDPDFAELVSRFEVEPAPRLRAVIDVEVTRISDSCGFSLPLMDYVGDRDLLTRHNGRRSDENAATYLATRNAVSIDGLPAIDPVPTS
ncbi:pyridoxamine 5'-phosphate oxidase family protein [Actinoalloteichus caeruleus]|uniref:pyridoxamine 5'-phosphate oxidase family protein n=1 Tax=Actinoalloteichus cyanogriseus TaxID=2893586 RepID=UPI003AAB4570